MLHKSHNFKNTTSAKSNSKVYHELDNKKFAERFCRTLYYGKHASTDRPSKCVTDIAVEFLSSNGSSNLSSIDKDFAASVSRKSCISPCAMMLGLLYIERLKHRNPDYLQQVSSSDLFVISMMISSKFLFDEGEDDEVYNDEWAASANMETAAINKLERDFLQAIDWNLFIKPREFYDALLQIEQRIALSQATDRGWFSFTDLDVLTQDLDFSDIWSFVVETIAKVVAACCITYLAGLLSMVGAVMMVYKVPGHASVAIGNVVDYTRNANTYFLDNFSGDVSLLASPDSFMLEDVTVYEQTVETVTETDEAANAGYGGKYGSERNYRVECWQTIQNKTSALMDYLAYNVKSHTCLTTSNAKYLPLKLAFTAF